MWRLCLYSSGGMALYFSYCIVINPVLDRGGSIAGGTGALVSLWWDSFGALDP